jgi:hypothetical protein
LFQLAQVACCTYPTLAPDLIGFEPNIFWVSFQAAAILCECALLKKLNGSRMI